MDENFFELVEKATMAGLLEWQETGSEEVGEHIYKSYRATVGSRHLIEIRERPRMGQTLFRRRVTVVGTAFAIIIEGGGERRWWSNWPNVFVKELGSGRSSGFEEGDVGSTARWHFFFATMRHLIEDRDVLATLRTALARQLYSSPQAV